MNPPMNPTASHDAAHGQALEITRFFTDGETHPFDAVEWEMRDARIGHGERVAFEQQGVEFPTSWSQNATNIVSQKYFRGQLGSPEREHSVRQMIGRVAGTITRWGREGGYFAADRDARGLRARAHPHPAAPDGGVQLARVVQRGLRGAAAVLGLPPGPRPRLDAGRDGPDRRARGGRNGRDRGLRLERLHARARGQAQRPQAGVAGGPAQRRASSRPPPTTSSRPSAERRSRAQWLRVDQLQPGMRMHLHPHKAKVADPVRVTVGGPGGESALELIDETDRTAVAEAALAGWLQADGFVGPAPERGRAARWRSSSRSPATRSSLGQRATSTWPFRTSSQGRARPHSRAPRCGGSRLHGEALRGFVERWGLLACGTEARVPERLYTASHEEIAAYLRSVFQADGYVSVRHSGGYESARVGVAAISERWSEDVQLLLGTLGIYSRRTRRREKRDDRNELFEVCDRDRLRARPLRRARRLRLAREAAQAAELAVACATRSAAATCARRRSSRSSPRGRWTSTTSRPSRASS